MGKHVKKGGGVLAGSLRTMVIWGGWGPSKHIAGSGESTWGQEVAESVSEESNRSLARIGERMVEAGGRVPESAAPEARAPVPVMSGMERDVAMAARVERGAIQAGARIERDAKDGTVTVETGRVRKELRELAREIDEVLGRSDRESAPAPPGPAEKPKSTEYQPEQFTERPKAEQPREQPKQSPQVIPSTSSSQAVPPAGPGAPARASADAGPAAARPAPRPRATSGPAEPGVAGEEVRTRTYRPRTRKTVPQALRPGFIDKSIKILGAILVIIVVALAGYYGYNRYKSRAESSRAAAVTPQIEQAVIKNPRDINARTALAESYLNQGRIDEAIEQYRQALKLNKNHQPALVGLGVAYMKAGDDAKALRYLEQEIDQYGMAQYRKENNYLELAYYYAGVMWFKKKQYDQTIDYLNQALTIKSGDADTYFVLGRAYMEKRQYNEAIPAFEEALKFTPDFADPHYGLGYCYERKGEKERAIDHYEKALDLNKDFAEAKAALKRLKS